jgi:hypothetical protein
MKKTISRTKCARAPIILLLTVIFSNSCETPSELNQVTSARQWFETNLGGQWDALPTVSEISSIDWTNAVANGKSIEVPVRFKGDLAGYVYDGSKSIKGKIHVRLVLWPVSNGYEAVVLEFVHVGGNIPRHLGELNQSKFSGMIRASYGATKKYASLFEQGEQYSYDDEVSMSTGRLQTEACLYFIYENTIHIGTTTLTYLTFELQYCYDITAPQVPLPPEGGGWVLDYSGGGGGGGTQTNFNPGFPTDNPQNGDIFEIEEPNGKVIRYTYYEHTGWKFTFITLPEGLATMYNYPYLFNVPTSIVVTGPDGLQWSFNEAIQSWIGAFPQVVNNIQNPCVRNIANSLTDVEFANQINELINDVFGDTNNKVNVILNEDNTLPSRARTQVTSEGDPFDVTITLNATWLAASSQEYIADVIYHEAIHAYLNATGYSRDQLEQHVEIAENYVLALKAALLELFPDMDEQDATGLSLRGLNDVMEHNPSYWNTLLNDMGYTSHEHLLQETNPFQAGSEGTICPN